MNDGPVFDILGVFSLLSVLAIGGGTAVLPEMKSVTIDQLHWLTDEQFRSIYGIGQLAPGPNMLMVAVVGYKVAGPWGAVAAFAGFFLPSSAICFVATRIWNRFTGSPWKTAIQQAFAPIVVGLMLSGTISIARTAVAGGGHQEEAFALATLAFIILYFGKGVKPVYVILAGAVFGFVFLQSV